MATEIDFPRGGTPKILFRTTQHQQQLKIDGNGDYIEGKQTSEKRGVKRSVAIGKNKQVKKGKLSAEEAVVDEDLYATVFRQTISPELLAQNLRGLAFVKFIGELEVILECVDGIQLNLAADRISRIFITQLAHTKATLKDIFYKGQAFAFKVVQQQNAKNDDKRKRPHCAITTCPYEVNSQLIPSTLLAGTILNGIVSSIEEKGTIIDLGFSTSSVKGFVQSEELPPHLQLPLLHIGQVAMFRVKEKPTGTTRVIKLTGYLEMDTLDEADSQIVDGRKQQQLMPGTIVQVQPEKTIFDGVFVGIKNGPKAYIKKVHLPPRLRYNPKPLTKPFRACILCTQPNSPLLVLSAHPDVVALSKNEKRLLPADLKIGSRIDGIVYHVDKKQNVYFRLDNETDSRQTITAKCLRINIENIEENLQKFTIGSEHECRIMGYSSMERQLFVSTRKSDLEKKIVAAEEAMPGTKLKGTIKAIRQNGLIVVFGNGMSGYVSAMHVLDRPVEKWQKRFQRDQQILCRVLFTESASNKLILTAKPSMVKKTGTSKLITGYDKQFEGITSHGVVIKQLDGGSLLIAFFNRAAGILNQHKASMLPAEMTQIGASIKVCVKSVNPEMAQVVLDLPADGIGKQAEPITKLALGMEKAGEERRRRGGAAGKTKLAEHAKPFRIYTAKVVGPWPYGGTSAETTAEMLLPGGSVGRLHVSELNNLHEYPEGTRPMRQFLDRNKGKTVNVKVLSVSKNRAIPKAGKDLLMDLRQSDRIVECTARQDKLEEARKKLTLLNYRSEFDIGSLVPVFLVAPNLHAKAQRGFSGEINPDFHAYIPRDQIKIPSILERIEKLTKDESPAAEVDYEELFDRGEMRFGRVQSVSKTKRGRYLQLELVPKSAEAPFSLENKPKRKSRKSLSESEKDIEISQRQQEEKEVKEEVEDDEEGDNDDEDEEEGTEMDEEDEKQGMVDSELAGVELGSVAEYETVVVAQPYSVPHWIGFIQFHLSKAKSSAKRRYESGREVAERALKTVTFQNDAELATLWKAYLNLEVLLGTEESLDACFKRACASSKSQEMHKYLIKLLKEQPNSEGRDEEICHYFESFIKKFRHTDLEPWFAFAKHLLQRGEADESRQLLNRALQCTEKRKHLTILNKFTQLEEQYGDEERAKTMRELVRNYKGGGKQQLDLRALGRAMGGGQEKNHF